MAEEEKLFEVLTKIYTELQTEFTVVNKKFDNIEVEIACIKDCVESLKVEVEKNIAKIDEEVIQKQQELIDGHKQIRGALFKTEENIGLLKDNMSDLNNYIYEMKEDVNFIAGKSISNYSKLEKLNNQLKAAR